MSALAHMIEAQGIATTVIGLVRPHLENSRPPRAVWVPFPLGRPLGEPENPAFQRRVLEHALRLFDRKDGPVILEDFPEDAPSMTDTAGWRPEVALPQPLAVPPNSAAAWVTAIDREIAAVRYHWDAAQSRYGRTTVGVSRLPPDAWAGYAAAFLEGRVPQSPIAGVSPAVALRYVTDDLKAFYSEAVQAIGPQPSPAQVNRWFWSETLAGDFLRVLRTAALASENAGFQTAGGRFIVPGPFVNKA